MTYLTSSPTKFRILIQLPIEGRPMFELARGTPGVRMIPVKGDPFPHLEIEQREYRVDSISDFACTPDYDGMTRILSLAEIIRGN